MTDRELEPVDRYTWEKIICRARLGGLIGPGSKVGKDGRPTRGGVSAATFRAVALVWATHADPDGTRIYPGDATLAVEAEVSLKVAQAVKAKLVELGLTERVRAGSRRNGRGDEYRLTLPSDLLDVVEMLSPEQLRARAVAEYEKRRGKRPVNGGSAGTPTATVDDSNVGGPPVPPHPVGTEVYGGSAGPTEDVYGGSAGPFVGGPPDRDTNPDQPPIRPNPIVDHSRTESALSARATPPQDQIPATGGTHLRLVTDPPPPRPPRPAHPFRRRDPAAEAIAEATARREARRQALAAQPAEETA